MNDLVQCDEFIPTSGEQLTAGAFLSFNYAEEARRIMEETTGKKWTVWYVEYHFDGCHEGDPTHGMPTP